MAIFSFHCKEKKTGQLNAITQIDMGDHSFGTPARITARTFAGENGLLNIAHEVEMSGPIHDKGVLILQNYLSALFAHLAPLALNASIVFEQEYTGIEGDSASCAEIFCTALFVSQRSHQAVYCGNRCVESVW